MPESRAKAPNFQGEVGKKDREWRNPAARMRRRARRPARLPSLSGSQKKISPKRPLPRAMSRMLAFKARIPRFSGPRFRERKVKAGVAMMKLPTPMGQKTRVLVGNSGSLRTGEDIPKKLQIV